jgi:nicotinamidase/pyrazinamidase
MKHALVVLDMQNDFVLPSGTLIVPGAGDVVKKVNAAVELFGQHLTVFTKDWHPADSKHFERWPVHCVADTFGADLVGDLYQPKNGTMIVRKGVGSNQDGYSAFRGTRLEYQLNLTGVDTLLFCGVALEICVRTSVLDALQAGFKTVVLSQACAAIDPAKGAKAFIEMRNRGVQVL